MAQLTAALRGHRLTPRQNTDDEGSQRTMHPAEAGKAQYSVKPHTSGASRPDLVEMARAAAIGPSEAGGVRPEALRSADARRPKLTGFAHGANLESDGLNAERPLRNLHCTQICVRRLRPRPRGD